MHRFQSSIILVRNLSFSSQWEDTVCVRAGRGHGQALAAVKPGG